MVVLSVGYIVVLNVVTTYRLLYDESYTPMQKVLQSLLIWMLPLIGAVTIAYFLNQFPHKATKWWQRHWLSAGLLSLVLHIRYAQMNPDSYPSSMNEYGCDAAEWDDGYRQTGWSSDMGCDGGGD